MEASSFSLPQFLLGHLYHEADGGVCVVLLVVRDQRWNLICAVQHRLQHILFVDLSPRNVV